MNNKTLSCDITEDLTCPVCGVKIDSTEIPWSQLNNYVEFECIECEHKIWAEWQPYVLIGKVDPFAEKTTLNRYRLRIPALSLLWHTVDANSEEEALQKVVDIINSDTVDYSDKACWEIEKLCTCGKPVIAGDWCEDHMPR